MGLFNGPKGEFVIVDYILLLSGLIVNIIIFDIAIRIRLGLTGYRHFLISLLCSDIFTCLVMLCQSIFFNSDVEIRDPAMANLVLGILRGFQVTGFIAIFLNLVGMSVDHYVGVLKPLRYNQLVSKRNVRISVLLIWTLSILFGFAEIMVSKFTSSHNSKDKADIEENSTEFLFSILEMLATLPDDEVAPNKESLLSTTPGYFNYSEFQNYSLTTGFNENIFFHENSPAMQHLKRLIAAFNQSDEPAISPDNESENISDTIKGLVKSQTEQSMMRSKDSIWPEVAAMVLTILCFIFLSICYGKIFHGVSRKIGIYSNKNTRRLVITTVLMLGAFAICWLPFMTFELVMIYGINMVKINDPATFFAIHNVFNTLLMCSPVLDAFIYAWRIRVIRRNIISRYIPCCSLLDNNFRNSPDPTTGEGRSKYTGLPVRRLAVAASEPNFCHYKTAENVERLPRKTSDVTFRRTAIRGNSENNNAQVQASTSYDRNTIYRYVDDDDDMQENEAILDHWVTLQLPPETIPMSQSTEGNFLSVASDKKDIHEGNIAKSASTSAFEGNSHNPVEQRNLPHLSSMAAVSPTLRTVPKFRPNFCNSDEVISKFRVNSFRLLGPGAKGALQSLTLTCPTIHY